MSRQEALLQSLATSGAVLITFIGVCHEVVGAKLFPWAPPLFGGPIGWHGLGIGAIVVGCLLIGAALRMIQFPVIPVTSVIAVVAVAIGVFTAVVYREFHVFAFTVALAAVTMGVCQRKALRLAMGTGA